MILCQSKNRGVALVSVLAILTILAIIAVSFSSLIRIESESSKNVAYYNDAVILAEAGLQHAKSVLWHDGLYGNGKVDSYQDGWRTAFAPADATDPGVDLDLMSKTGVQGVDGKWIKIYDKNNILVGRYAVLIEDEASKINLNVASLISPQKGNEGLSTHEISLGDGKKTGLPFSKSQLKKLLSARYGNDNLPGSRIDDNLNNSYLMDDGLDNNADGQSDELDEGVNEAEEYVADQPFGDDRKLFNLRDTVHLIDPELNPTAQQMAYLRKYATLHSKDNGYKWNESKKKWDNAVNINVASAKDLFKTLKSANVKYKFEGNSKELRRLAATMADYRDENNVLSTVSSEYGVESVCFNEILSNEGSQLRLPYRNSSVYGEDRRVHSLPYYYGAYNYRKTSPYNSSDVGKKEKFDRNAAFPILRDSIKKTGGLVRLKVRDFPWSGGGYNNGFNDFKTLLKKRRGFMREDQIIWPENMWQNGYLSVYSSIKNASLPLRSYKISKSTRDNEIYLTSGNGSGQVNPQDFANLTNGTHWIAHIRSWVHEKAYYAEHPKVNMWSVFSGLDPEKYYRVYIQETNLTTPTGDSSYGNDYATELDVDGNFLKSSQEEMHRMRFAYKGGEAQRADKVGCADVYLTSARNCDVKKRNRFNAAYFARPDIIELKNIGRKPISLKGWSLVANTGKLAYELGVINSATGYSREDNRRLIDPNPVIRPNEYFYLCNNEEIFDYDHGSGKNGIWGSGPREQMPIFEISDDQWGMKFEITKVRETSSGSGQHTYITCGDENWRPDQFLGEVAEFQTDRQASSKINSPDGIRYLIEGGNTRDTLLFTNLTLEKYSDIKPGDYVMIVGLPKIGGFVSMTLKDQYGQITARLLEYGNPAADATKDSDRWLNYSSEKSDPTRENWIMTKDPTFGGTIDSARNRSSKILGRSQAKIKNGLYGSVAEVEKVKRLSNWQDLVGEAKSSASRGLVSAAADFFTTSGIRLDAEASEAHIQGWEPAFGEAAASSRDRLVDSGAIWQNGIWTNQSLHILSGRMRGEKFSITKNSRNSILTDGRSVPSRKLFAISKGDKYSLGPGYSSSMYYSNKEMDAGEWEWKNKRIPKGNYKLSFYGLNDSINTTEFLEENHNTKLDVYIFNYDLNDYQLLSKDNKYDKNDSFFAGETTPANISDLGAIRIKIIPRGLGGKDNSNFAWFDYMYLGPMETSGKININTASVRVLKALPMVNQTLAQNIFDGRGDTGREDLKPYKNIAELVKVDGMKVENFGKIANLLTVRSDQFNVYVLAEKIEDMNHDGKYDSGDKIVASCKIRALIDRSGLYDDQKESIVILEKEKI